MYFFNHAKKKRSFECDISRVLFPNVHSGTAARLMIHPEHMSKWRWKKCCNSMLSRKIKKGGQKLKYALGSRNRVVAQRHNNCAHLKNLEANREFHFRWTTAVVIQKKFLPMFCFHDLTHFYNSNFYKTST